MKTTEQDCPQKVVARVRSADLSSADTADIFGWIAENSELGCQVHAVGAVADRINEAADKKVIEEFCAAAATYARFLEPEDKDKVVGAYKRIPYDKAIHFHYFSGLRLNKIDIRNRLAAEIEEDWSFTHPRKEAETWHYFLYLASLDEPGAYDALEKKISDTSSGNDVTNFLRSLSDLRTDGTKKILLKYRNDPRTSDGPMGPGPTVSEVVAIILNAYFP